MALLSRQIKGRRGSREEILCAKRRTKTEHRWRRLWRKMPRKGKPRINPSIKNLSSNKYFHTFSKQQTIFSIQHLINLSTLHFQRHLWHEHKLICEGCFHTKYDDWGYYWYVPIFFNSLAAFWNENYTFLSVSLHFYVYSVYVFLCSFVFFVFAALP